MTFEIKSWIPGGDMIPEECTPAVPIDDAVAERYMSELAKRYKRTETPELIIFCGSNAISRGAVLFFK